MTTFNWSVTEMECYPQEGGEADVVFNVHWTCNKLQDGFIGSAYSTCTVPTPSGDNFTPYSDLTKEQVLGWIWSNGVDKTATEILVQTQIDNQINPPVVTPPLPWAA